MKELEKMVASRLKINSSAEKATFAKSPARDIQKENFERTLTDDFDVNDLVAAISKIRRTHLSQQAFRR